MTWTTDYDREEFTNYLRNDFLPDDYESIEEENSFPDDTKVFVNAAHLGESNSLDTDVYEFEVRSPGDARVKSTREAFRLMKSHIAHANMLAVFHCKGQSAWRFSLITTTSVRDEKGNLKVKGSSPRRYSFLLGKGVQTHTIEQMIGRKEGNQVKDLSDLISRFSVEAVTKEFYNTLFKWYDERAIKCVKFPIGKGKKATTENGGGDTPTNREHLIRLITRIMFVWFIKQKWHKPFDWMFDKGEVIKVLRKGCDLHSMTDGTYYNAILQNLFFATLNRQIVDEEGRRRGFATPGGDEQNQDYNVKTGYRDDKDESFFAISHDEFAARMNAVPFLNGGLFECLDKDEYGKIGRSTGVVYRDGFSREASRRAFVPNALFFGDGVATPPKAARNDGKGGVSVIASDSEAISSAAEIASRAAQGGRNRNDGMGEGLIQIFSRYNFTVEESTPQDVQVALDPELLGKVFENLLASFNPETGESARKDSGSFYTPREIVGYMVDETLKSVIASGPLMADCAKQSNDEVAALFSDDDTPLDISDDERMALIKRITQLKILDPACGSGAFPMGVLQRMLSLLQRLDPASNETDEYERKRHLIENCIYGVDIQSIAMQIAKLRFFISLVIEQDMTGDANTNYGIRALPNLETKFVCANTLIGVEHNDGMFVDSEMEAVQSALLDVRRQYVAASTCQAKSKLQKQDREYVKQLLSLLQKNSMCSTESARLLAAWSPYNQTSSAPFFDPAWMFMLTGGFDAVVGNPPYGAKTTDKEKAYYKATYPACRTEGGVKGSTDTFAVFINRGLDLLRKDGVLSFIVPMSVTSSDAMGALHKMMFETCGWMRVASFSRRPKTVFTTVSVRPSIFFCAKTMTPMKKLWTTKVIRRRRTDSVQDVIDAIEFCETFDLKMPGRFAKVGDVTARGVLAKMFDTGVRLEDYRNDKGKPFYYRAAGGEYFNMVTISPSGSTQEKELHVRYNTMIAAVLSSSLFWFYQQVYSDGLHLKQYEIANFPLPKLEDIPADTVQAVEALYGEYLADIERNVIVHQSTGYKVSTFKEYKIRKSKPIIDRIDSLICPLYGLTPAETSFIKGYEAEFRMEEE